MRRSSPASIGRAPSFHCDPSCWGWGCENCYGKALFAREGFTRLADPLRTLQGLVLLSINDMPAIRKICAGFTIREGQVMYSANDKGNKQPSEWLIGNVERDGQGQSTGCRKGMNRLFQGAQTPDPQKTALLRLVVARIYQEDTLTLARLKRFLSQWN